MDHSFEPLSPDPVYDQALAYLYGLQKFGIKFGLSKTENLLKAFGNPQDQLQLIHIAGTNGKGSVAAMLASIFSCAGYRTGLYTSPHLLDFRERFRIDGRMITRDRTLELIEEVRSRTNPEEPPTFFELVTALGLIYFAREKVEVGIIETGLGGRLDATNIIRPRITIITTVSREHQEYLGRNIQQIAREKAGIIKPGVPLVTGVTQPAARRVIEDTCREQGVPLFQAGHDFHTRKTRNGDFQYQGMGRKLKGLRTALAGDHQIRNAGLALSAALLWDSPATPLGEDALREGLSKVDWPGRMELVPGEPPILLDGAHNPEAMKALAHSLPRLFTYNRLFLIIGIMQDKDITGVLYSILSLADRVLLTRAAYNRSAAPERLFSLIARGREKCQMIPNLIEAIAQARAEAGRDDLICITGSLFLVGEAKGILDKDIG